MASDYDGTMAPIVADPEKAHPRTESGGDALRPAALPATAAALISGRALRDLATLSRLPAEVQLVGSHGSEFDIGFVHAIDEAPRHCCGRSPRLGQSRPRPGRGVETKPASIALHVRNAAPADADEALKKAMTCAPTWDGVQVTEGKAVVELAVIHTDKGQALDILRHQQGASAAVFFGDDVTDEKAFGGSRDPISASRSAPATRWRTTGSSTEDVAAGAGVPARGAAAPGSTAKAPPRSSVSACWRTPGRSRC